MFPAGDQARCRVGTSCGTVTGRQQRWFRETHPPASPPKPSSAWTSPGPASVSRCGGQHQFSHRHSVMTVCVAIKVHDCIVFAADSAVSLASTDSSGHTVIANVWEHGAKVFHLHKELPIVAMTAGLGQFGPASVSNLAKDLRIELSRTGGDALDKTTYTIEETTERARSFFEARYLELDPRPADPYTFEFWVGGYGANNSRGEIWKVEIRNGVVQPIVQLAKAEDDQQLTWGGQTKAIGRLIFGCDPEFGSILERRGHTKRDISEITRQLVTPLVDSSMPVQDAINLANFLVDVAKKYSAFLPGANVVGGNTDIATVTKHEGFKWINRKYYYSRDLNPMETGHAT